MARQDFFSKVASISFGIFSVQGIAAWTLAGAVAYLYFVLPSQKEEKEVMIRREYARRRALERGELDTDRRAGA